MSALVTDTGLNLIRDAVNDVLTHVAVGTNDTAPAAGQTALVAEVFRDVIAQKIKGDQSLVVKLVLGQASANGQTLREVGVFNADTGGVMYTRGTPALALKTADTVLLYTVTLQWSRTVV